MSRAQDRVESLSFDSHSVLKQRPNSSNTPSSYLKSAQSNAPSKSSYKSLLENRNPSKSGADNRATPREEDDQQRASPSDVLNTGGSASSLSSAASSIFSTNLSAHAQNGSQFNMNNLTPLTHTESSPPGKMLSPRSQKRSYEQMHNGTTTSPYLAPATNSRAVSETITPVQTPPEPNLQARPGPGEVKGYKITLDPEILPNKKDRKNLKPTYREFGAENEPSAPPDPRLAIAGYTTGAYHNKPSKAKVRVAPYVVRRYPLDKYSIGPGRPTKVVVTGFNILTAESKIRSLLSSFGDLDKCENHIDPSTGAPLGVFSATFKDKVSPRKNEVVLKAADAAQRAEKEGSGMRIDQVAIKIETDREGVKCRKYMDRKLAMKRKEQEKFREEELRKRPPPPPSTPAPGLAPPTAPKGPRGPSARAAMAPPSGPAGPRVPVVALAPKPAAHSLVEVEAILPQMKRTPFLFLAHCYVPVLGTTIAHLKKRLRAYDWDAVRCDRTGYFVTYKSTRLGEQECERTFKECHMFPLFTYTMNFELHKKGNRNHVRSPSPEKVAAQSREKEQRRKIRQDDELDFEAEKKERAENLDPVKAALELLMPELRDTIMKEVRAKIALPHIFDCLHPDKHKEKRAKLGLPDPREAEALKPIISLSNQLLASGQQVNRQKLLNKKPFGKFTKQPRDRREELKQPVNVYDERRKRPVQSKARPIVPLHRRLQEYRDEEDSDDERQTTITRDSEGPDSHPVSEIGVSPARFDVEEEGLRTPKAKRRRLEAGWGAESDDEAMELVARRALGHLLDKEPEDMAMGELQQVLSTFPRSSELRQRAAAEVKLRHKAKQDDKLFGIVPPEVVIEPASVDIIIEDAEMRDSVPEPVKTIKKKAGVAKPKKKTKKEVLAEEEAAKAEAKAEEEAFKAIEAEEATPAVEEGEEPRAEVLWALSTDAPRKTVEDDPNLLLDIDGWQNILKDEEDVRFLLEALQTTKTAKIADAKLWAWKEKEFKALNSNGARGITNQITRIEGYYVPNLTGSARTEGYKKISQTEKSKYLPHRIRVQKAREEREREANNDPQKAVVAAKAAAAAKIASTATSRSNRANNRRLINEITISKQALGADADALKFNQLKKRKKLVRFDRSAIHNWGLYAEENIAASDMIIEYVGEKVRQRVADLREINYQKQGIGSSYLFRIDEDTVVDATKKGGIARFINHSCVPNCTAKIIRVDGTKRIVIYALRDIAKNEELTYDYKFEREINSDDRIPCLCGSVGCKGFLN